jgi:exosortase
VVAGSGVWSKQLLLATAVLGALSIVLYWHVMMAMAAQWASDPNWSHGFLVPPFALWLAWRDRKRWLEAGGRGSWLGLPGVAAAVVLLALGSLAAELFTTRFSLILLLASLVLLVGGWRRLRALAFPLGFLLFMIPWPAVIYAQVTFPLEFLASRLAAEALRLVQVPVLREGNLLVLANYTLQVAQACSGIRSLVSLVTLAVFYAYLAESRIGLRLALIALMGPIAVVSNAFRIFGAGVLTEKVSTRLAHGFFHEFSGWLIFVAASFLMLATHWALRRIARLGRDDEHA